MKFENTHVFNLEGAIRGMRNPKNSWERSDSGSVDGKYYVLGENDLKLAQTLIKAGAEHRKFMRQIFVSVDITAPAYFMAELDTYKIGTTRNSSSFMHKGVSKSFEKEDFELDSMHQWMYGIEPVLNTLNYLRDRYLETKNYKYFRAIRQLLPMSYLYRSTITMTYENLYNICKQRKQHRLNEWSGIDNPNIPNFISWARTLPYAQELIFIDELDEVN